QRLIRAGPQANRWAFAGPAPRTSLKSFVNVLDEVGFGVQIRHVEDTCSFGRSFEKRALRGRRIWLRKVAAAAQKPAYCAEQTRTESHFPVTIANLSGGSAGTFGCRTRHVKLKGNTMKYLFILALASTPLLAQTLPAAVPDNTVVANVDGKDVTAGEIRQSMAYMPNEFIQLFQQNPKYAVQQLFMLRYLSEEAEKAKLGEQSPLKEQLAFLRANSMASAMVSHEHNFYPVSNQQIKEFYDKNQARYQQAKIKVIYIGFKPSAPLAGPVPSGKSLEDVARAISEGGSSQTQRTEADARKLAEDLVKQIRGGADFMKLVAEYSEDSASKAAGGDFGVVNINSSYSADVKKAVLALKAGEVTDPLRQSNAFYIIRAEEKSIQPMAEVTVSISEEIRGAHLNQWLAEVSKRFEPTVKSVEFFTQPKLALPGAAGPGGAGPGAGGPGAAGRGSTGPANGVARPAPPAK